MPRSRTSVAAEMPAGVRRVELDEKELVGSDAVIVLTDHDAFDYDLVASSAAYVLDTRNRCHGPHVERL